MHSYPYKQQPYYPEFHLQVDLHVVEPKLRGQLNFNSFKDSGIATGLIKMSIKNENVHDYD